MFPATPGQTKVSLFLLALPIACVCYAAYALKYVSHSVLMFLTGIFGVCLNKQTTLDGE